jgi:hypothetical protein
MPRDKSNIAIDSLPDTPNIVRNYRVFVKIYDSEPILTVVTNIGEDAQYRCFN